MADNTDEQVKRADERNSLLGKSEESGKKSVQELADLPEDMDDDDEYFDELREVQILASEAKFTKERKQAETRPDGSTKPQKKQKVEANCTVAKKSFVEVMFCLL